MRKNRMRIPFQFKKNVESEDLHQKTVSLKKTLVAVPTAGMMLPAMVKDLIALLIKSRTSVNTFYSVDGCVIQHARNEAAVRMLESGCDGLLFIDSDQVFPHYALDRLIETDKPVVGFPVIRKSQPYDPNISQFNEEKKQYECYRNYPQGRLFEVGYIGTGFTYIKREVIEKMTYPYFDFVWIDDEKSEHGKKMMGEDVYFCQKAKEAGFGVWADSTIQIGHIGNFNYMPQLHFNFQRVLNAKEEK